MLIVDDHPLFREGFASALRTLRPAWTLRLCDNAESAAQKCRERLPDVVLIDVGLPRDDGFALLKILAAISETMPQILISGRDDAAVRMRARAGGARGFIPKTATPDDVVRSIESVLAGGTCFDPKGLRDDLPILTPRQIEVLTLLADGHSNKEIRHRLNIAERTVRAHLTELFQALGAHSRMQALLRARELGFIA